MQAAGSSAAFLAYTIFTILSFLLTTSALGAIFAVLQKTSGQTIDLGVAAANQGHGYPLDKWAPGVSLTPPQVSRDRKLTRSHRLGQKLS